MRETTVVRSAKDQLVTYTHAVSGDIWMERYAGNKAMVDGLKEACLLQLDSWAYQRDMEFIEGPKTTVEYDEKHRIVHVIAEGVAVERG